MALLLNAYDLGGAAAFEDPPGTWTLAKHNETGATLTREHALLTCCLRPSVCYIADKSKSPKRERRQEQPHGLQRNPESGSTQPPVLGSPESTTPLHAARPRRKVGKQLPHEITKDNSIAPRATCPICKDILQGVPVCVIKSALTM
jgi:hypothetical protein